MRTKKLVFDNGEQAILMCGNINFPCIPEGKEICLGERSKYNSFVFYKKNKNENQCYDFMNKIPINTLQKLKKKSRRLRRRENHCSRE